jgi:hypothetical protein
MWTREGVNCTDPRRTNSFSLLVTLHVTKIVSLLLLFVRCRQIIVWWPVRYSGCQKKLGQYYLTPFSISFSLNEQQLILRFLLPYVYAPAGYPKIMVNIKEMTYIFIIKFILTPLDAVYHYFRAASDRVRLHVVPEALSTKWKMCHLPKLS